LIISSPLLLSRLSFRLFKNRIKIDSAGISPATQKREQKSRGVLRRKNIAPQVVNFSAKCESPNKDEDESFYSSGSLFKSSPSTSSICHASDEIEVLGSSHGSTIQHSVASNSRSTSTGVKHLSAEDNDTKTSYDSVYCSPKSPLDSENENEIVELIAMESMDVESPPQGLQINDLLFSDIKTESTEHKRSARKRLNMNGGANENQSTPKSSTISSLLTTPDRVCLANISNNLPLMRSATGLLKRPDPPAPMSPFAAKKLRYEEESIHIPRPSLQAQLSEPLVQTKRPIFRKSVSVDEAAMMFNDNNKTADFCYELCLPIMSKVKHSDLKSISPETMKRLLSGEFDHSVASYKVIDCRYPYEFEGGHIRGALNLYTEEQIQEEFVKVKPEVPHVDADGKRNIIIFHCEFSSERGPRQ
jgi:hypothetical protein